MVSGTKLQHVVHIFREVHYMREVPLLRKRLKSFFHPVRAGIFIVRKKLLRIIFMGTPEFSCPSLEKLIQKGKVVGVVTQPDRPSGRGKKLTLSPTKRLAVKEGIPVYQPLNVNQPSFVYQLRKIAPDFIVVVAFGQILSADILSIPKICCINLHPSLLPRYRGPAPIPRAIINGENETGVTIQKIEQGVDKGGIILQKKMSIDIFDTAKSLEKKLSLSGAELLIKAIKMIKGGMVKYKAQNELEASYAPRIGKEEGMIDWTQSCLQIHNKVRGLNPYPGAFSFCKIRGKKNKIKIWETELTEENLMGKKERRPGEIAYVKKNKGFLVRGEDGLLLIKKVQLPSRNAIFSYDFIKGYQIKEGVILGD